MQTVECAVMLPAVEMVIQRAARREIFPDHVPLTTRSKNIHQVVHDLPYIHYPFVAATLGSRDQGVDQ